MANIHPSRLGLVPGASTQPSNTSVEPNLDREQQLRQKLYESRRSQRSERQASHDAYREEGGRERERKRSGSPERDGNQRRQSPTYESYDRRRPPPPRPYNDRWEPSQHPNPAEANMYPPRDSNRRQDSAEPRGESGWRRGPPTAYPSDAGFFESRNQQRKESTFSIWPASPRASLSESDEDREKDKKQKRSSRDDDRRRHKSSHSSSKHSRSKHSSSRHKTDRHSSSRRKSKYSEDEDETSSEDEREKEKRRRRHGSKSRSHRDKEQERSRSRSPEDRNRRRRRKADGDHSEKEDKDERSSRRHRRRSASVLSSSSSTSSLIEPRKNHDDAQKPHDSMDKVANESEHDDNSDVEVGPMLPQTKDGKPVDPKAYGGALLPGEGSAMASFVQEGKRIPRRGEIGLSSDQIESFENVGYVMSGSRHHRMNAVRMRKENQVISAEEKRSILRLQAEEKSKKEVQIISQFKEMVDSLQPKQPGQ